MYESHFGFSGPPFQLVPDPGFFYGSRGHSNALAFLQSAAHQGDGFLVVTGEIGAGKTTLVRTLLEGLDVQQVQAATMVSTQLESGDLPAAILLAFGASPLGDTKAQLNATLEAYLIEMAGKGRRALLIVDEAQNLNRLLIEELRMLSNLQLGSQALLQVFLVGQPELRTQMQAKAMEQLRQRVTASCHLGPLDANETRAYVEHRLRRVGWVEKPPIEPLAFAQIHQWTAGIPRRINRLCNRLLLATFLEGKDGVTAEAVEQIARDLRAEIGESDEQPTMQESYVSRAEATLAPAVAPHEATPAGAAPPSPEAAVERAADTPGTVALETTAVAAPVDEDAGHESASNAVPAPASVLETATHEAPRRAPVESVALNGALDDPVIEVDEELEADLPLTRLPAPADLRGVVAAHEMPLPTTPARPGRSMRGGPAPAEGLAPRAALHGDPSVGTDPQHQQTPVARFDVDLPLELMSVTPPAPLKQPAHQREPQPSVTPTRSVSPARETAAAPGTLKGVLEPLICLVDSASDYVKARALGRVLSENRELPSVLIVHTGSVANLDVGEEISGVMPQKTSDVHLDINEHGGAASAALAITRFDAVLRVYRPRALIAMGTSDTLLTCALFAHKSGIPILRNDAGRRRAWSRPGEEMNAALLERLADTSYISDLATYYTLYRSGIPTDRVLLVGNLADNVLHFAAQHTVHPAEILRRVGTPIEALAHPRGYALCTVQVESTRTAHGDEFISMLALVGRELPVLWVTNDVTAQELKSLGKLAALRTARIELAPGLRFLDCIDLLRGARCLLSGSAGQFLDEAVTLGVPSIVLGQGMLVPVKSTEALQLSAAMRPDQLTNVLAELLAGEVEPREKPPFWDGATAARIGAHLTEWLPLHGANKKRGKPVPESATTATQRPKHPDAAIEMMGVTTP